jgi:hypothetical protein
LKSSQAVAGLDIAEGSFATKTKDHNCSPKIERSAELNPAPKGSGRGGNLLALIDDWISLLYTALRH